MIEYVGWLGAILLTISSIPQMIQSLKRKNSEGVNSLFICLMISGALLSIVYSTYHGRWPLVLDHTVLTISFLIIGYYKIFPKK